MKNIISVLPDRLKTALGCKKVFSSASEITIRHERPSCVSFGKEILYISSNGLTSDPSKAVLLYRYEIDDIFAKICKSSVYSFEDQIRNGFISLGGGHRVGICGTAVVKNGDLVGFRDINGFVFRIAREIVGVAKNVSKYIISPQKVVNTAIISPPGGGKTTILRDMCRILGEKGYKVSVVDERGELCGVSDGVSSFSSCLLCDILDCCPKADGIDRALRTLCPDVIVFDEIGSLCEADNLVSAMNSGVSFIFSAHAESFSQATKRPAIKKLLDCGALDLAIVLGTKEKRGTAVEIISITSGGDGYKADRIDIDPVGKFILGDI